ncbi:MAG: flippase-like domain-containing protein [Candidatus Rokubacteria bacterium]|nr:flippase-like domain-containing protein [Candidatus Rokubacteria bacterium]
MPDAAAPPARLRQVAARFLRPFLVVAGVAVVAYLIWRVGPAEVWGSITTLSWRLLLVVLFPTVLSQVLDAVGWHFAFAEPRASLGKLWAVRLAGEAVNLSTPTASVGGEPLKAYLLRPPVPLGEGLVSVVIDKTATAMGQAAFLGIGLAVSLLLVPLPARLGEAMGVLWALQALGLGAFLLVQLRGPAGRSGRLLRRFGWGPSEANQTRLEGMDRGLAEFYGRRPGRFAASLALHTLAWVVGSLEIYLVLRFLDLPVSLATALVLQALGDGIRFASFMIPGGLGVLEGGNMAIFAAMGLGMSAGLTCTLVRRIREAVWAGAGYLVLAAMSRTAGHLQ